MTARSALLAAIVLSPVLLHGQQLSLQITAGFSEQQQSAADRAGNIYDIVFENAPTAGAAQTKPGGGNCLVPRTVQTCSDAHLTKTDVNGNIIFSTLLGGSGSDRATAVTVDGAGFSYVTGQTTGNFPTTPNTAIPSASIPPGVSCCLAFLVKLSPDGSQVVYATYLWVGFNPSGIAADADGNAYVTGQFADKHAIVIKISADGSTFLYTQTFSFSDSDSGVAIGVDSAGNATMAGWLKAANSTQQNLVVVKLDPSGATLAQRVLGGTGVDSPNAVAVDSDGSAVITGSTSSLDFPTTAGAFRSAAYVPLWATAPGGFVLKLSSDLATTLYSTYVESTLTSSRPAFRGITYIALGDSGDVYVTGQTGARFPVTGFADQPCASFVPASFVAHLDSKGALLDASYTNGGLVYGLAREPDGSIVNFVTLGVQPAFQRVRFAQPANACLSSSVVDSAAFTDAQEVVPGQFMTLTGLGIGPEQGIGEQPDALGRPSTSLGGVQVLFDGIAAPLLYAQSRQINALVPFEIQGESSTNLSSTSITVQFQGMTFGPISKQVRNTQGTIFRRAPDVSSQALAVNEDQTPNSAENPVARGSVVILLGTGFGQVSGCATSDFNPPALVSIPPSVSTQNAVGSLGSIAYLGSAPMLLCGVEQMNLRINTAAAPGKYSLYGADIYIK
jgi:uncharacterized protein (TIGR03437 family)